MLIVETSVCFFFKQKTAYEMRISDWSSDVCSSDLYSLSNGGTPPTPGSLGFLPTQNQCETGSFTPDSSASPGTTLAQNFSVKSKKGTYTLGINWQATPDLLLYATTRRGYRAGGFNVPKLDASVANLQRSEEHTSEIQSLMRISYAVFCL